MKHRVVRWAVAIGLLAIGTLWHPQESAAQISPGDLSNPHKQLEGMTNCTQCHELGKGPSRDKCLACHQTLAARIQQGKGFHGRMPVAQAQGCPTCHNEHAGRDFELVHWPQGEKGFNHSESGFELQGRHAKLECQQCHKEALVDKSLTGSDLNRAHTFLGLSTDCLGCHVDEHRKQLGTNCTTCHNQDHWVPAPGFDHAKTKYPLTGQHAVVKCASCHLQLADRVAQDTSYTKYAGLKFQACTDCHKDPHQNKFGQNCIQCHSTSGWRTLAQKSIDHDKTAFPLRGKHVGVACEKCHTTKDILAKVPHSFCTDCHTDVHRKQFAGRTDGGRCESCHSVNGFTPAVFTVKDHATARFPLEGAHLAQTCLACHASTLSDVKGKYRRYRYEDRTCLACHNDIHAGQFVLTDPPLQCTGCHGLEQWRMPDFDHNARTSYKLEGAHKNVPCLKCHRTEQIKGQRVIVYRETPKRCEDCHGGKRPAGEVGQKG